MIGRTNAKAESGIDTSDATATAAELMYGKTAYVNGAKITGEGAYWQYVKTLKNPVSATSIFDLSLFGYIELYIPLCTDLSSTFYGQINITNVKITITDVMTKMYATFRNCPKIEIITIIGDTSKITTWYQCFASNTKLHTINSVLDFSSCTTAFAWFATCPNLQNIKFVQNTVKISDFNFSSSPLLTTTSLLSIANGLNPTTPNVLTMHATSKTNMNNIMVDNVAGEAVLGSAMTLTQFITNIKTWTIA